jgi:hypothetical protein
MFLLTPHAYTPFEVLVLAPAPQPPPNLPPAEERIYIERCKEEKRVRLKERARVLQMEWVKISARLRLCLFRFYFTLLFIILFYFNFFFLYWCIIHSIYLIVIVQGRSARTAMLS